MAIRAAFGIPNLGSEPARIGTCCHQIAAECLLDPERDPQDYIDRVMVFYEYVDNDGEIKHDEGFEDELDVFVRQLKHRLMFKRLHTVTVDQDLVNAVSSGIAYVREKIKLFGGIVEIEQAVPIGHITGEEGATGTSDFCMMVLHMRTIYVIDFKFGRHKVHASYVIEPRRKDMFTDEWYPEVRRVNLQLGMYAMGCLKKYELVADFDTVIVEIVQPFLNHTSSHTISIDELLEVQEFLRVRAIETRENPTYRPSEDACHFCLVSGNCAAQARYILEHVMDGDDIRTATIKNAEHTDLETLGAIYEKLPMILSFCKRIRERMEMELSRGSVVVNSNGLRYKQVQGEKGDRFFTDLNAVEFLLREDDVAEELIFNKKMVGPATIEKYSKSPRAKKGELKKVPIITIDTWNSIKHFIDQPAGYPSIVLETDERPEINRGDNMFEDVEDPDEIEPSTSSDPMDMFK